MDIYQHDKAFREIGFKFIAGIDEAGRGPLAGPVVASAVILPADLKIIGLRDSKKVPEKRGHHCFGTSFYPPSILGSVSLSMMKLTG